MTDLEPVLPFDPATERYVSLATFRRNGKPTPVWLARHNDCFYLFSESKAGKVNALVQIPHE